MELSRQYQELKSLWDLSQSLYRHLHVDDLIMQIINRIKEVMDVEAVTVILHDEAKNEFVFCWSSESPERAEKLKEIRFPADYGIAGSVFSTGRAEIILDVANDPRHYARVEAESNTEFKAESMIAAPLISKEKTLGVLEVINKNKGVFDEGDLSFVGTLIP